MRIVTRVTRQVQLSAGGVDDLEYYVVWCPKYQRPVLSDLVAGRREELIRAKAAERGCRMAALEIMPGHVGLFVMAHPWDCPCRVASGSRGSPRGACGPGSHICGPVGPRCGRGLVSWRQLARCPRRQCASTSGAQNERPRRMERAR